jgi:hypothetical protein
MWNDKKKVGISKKWYYTRPPLAFFSKSKHGEPGMKKVIDKINEWVTWWWANVKINK